MIHVLRQIALLTGKDLKIEARTRQTVGLVVVLGILIVVVLALGLTPQQKTSGASATTILWVAYLFSGVLCFEKTMAVERHDGALIGLLLAPVDRGVIFAAKLLSNLAFIFLVVLVITPIAVMFFGFDLAKAPGSFAAIMGLSLVGFAAVGTLFATAVSSSSLQGGLLALLVFPISLPLVITSTQMMIRLYGQSGEAAGGAGLAILVAFDAVFLVVSWLVFELVLEP